MKRLVITTILEPTDDTHLYKNLSELFKLSDFEIHQLNSGLELVANETEVEEGRLITKVKIEVFN